MNLIFNYNITTAFGALSRPKKSTKTKNFANEYMKDHIFELWRKISIYG